MNGDPLTYFITWTVYGTFLQGDPRGWRRRRQGQQSLRPNLANWRRDRLKHPIQLLDKCQASVVEQEIANHCGRRGWRLWEKAARSNHVHVIVSATSHPGNIVRDQLKANATRGLREQWDGFRGRPVWTKLGDWECINSESDLEAVVAYVGEAQDRMHLPKH